MPNTTEVPEGFQRTADEFTAQLQPSNLLERHYVEKIAAASWRLRRLHHWQARVFEDEALTEDERLNKLDRVLRHETNLNRQVDTAVRMLNNDVPRLYAGRAHADSTPDCQNEPAPRAAATPPGGHDFSERASSPCDASRPDIDANCRNEPAPTSSFSDSPRIGGKGVILEVNPSLTGRGGEPKASRGGSPSRPLTLTANGRLVPARTDAARRLLASA